MGLFLAYSYQNQPEHLLYTGFLYQHQGVPLWLTAGRALQEFEKSVKTPSLTIVKTEWLDTRDYSTNPGIPFDTADIAPVSIDKDGIDFGFVILKPYYLRRTRVSRKNPIEGMAAFDTTPRTKRRALTVPELTKLLNASPANRRVVSKVALCTGYRKERVGVTTLESAANPLEAVIS